MNKKQVKNAKTASEARQYAIDWQVWMSGVIPLPPLSYSEIAEWQDIFNELAIKFDLIDEFKENGIL